MIAIQVSLMVLDAVQRDISYIHKEHKLCKEFWEMQFWDISCIPKKSLWGISLIELTMSKLSLKSLVTLNLLDIE